MRAVIDTNVFVSSFFGGIPLRVIEHWFSGRLTLCVSMPILKEYFDVVSRFEFGDNSLLYRLMSAFEKNFSYDLESIRLQISDIAWTVGFDNDRIIQAVVYRKGDVWETPRRSSPFIKAIHEEGVVL